MIGTKKQITWARDILWRKRWTHRQYEATLGFLVQRAREQEVGAENFTNAMRKHFGDAETAKKKLAFMASTELDCLIYNDDDVVASEVIKHRFDADLIFLVVDRILERVMSEEFRMEAEEAEAHFDTVRAEP